MNDYGTKKKATLGDREVEYRKLTMGDMCRLGDRLHQSNLKMLKAQLAALYAAAGITESQLPMVVAEMTRRPSFTETWRWIYTPDGACEAAALITGLTVDDVKSLETGLEILEMVNDARSMRVAEEEPAIPLSNTPGEVSATTP